MMIKVQGDNESIAKCKFQSFKNRSLFVIDNHIAVLAHTVKF